MKKLISKTLTAGILTCIMLSCDNVASSFPEVDYVPFKVSENDNWGMISVEGKPLFEDEFENRPSISVNGVFSVTSGDGEMTYYFTDKKPKPVSDDVYIRGGYYTEGVIPVVKQEHSVSFINKEGKELLSLDAVEGKRIIAVNAYFSNGLMLFVTEDGKCGYINSKGQIVVKPIYDEALPFSEGLAVVGKKGSGNDKTKYTIINTTGKELADFRADLDFSPFAFSDGAFVNGNKVFDKNGQLAFRSPSKWKWIFPYYNGAAIFQENERYGLINKEGEVIIRAKYDYGIRKVGNGYIGINKSDGKYDVMFLDSDENRLEELEGIQNFDIFTKDRSVVEDQDEFYFIDNEGKAIDKNNYYTVMTPRSWSIPYQGSLFISFLHNLNSSSCQWILSDFYPANEAVASILNVLNTNGIENIHLGASLQEVMKHYNMGDSDTHSYNYWLNIEGVNGNGALKSSYRIEFDSYIANYYGYNNDARVKHIIINIDKSDVNCSNSEQRIYNAAIKYLENIGFSKSGHNDDWMDEEWDIYRSNKHNYLIAVNKDASKLCLESK